MHFNILNSKIGEEAPCFIIAEMSANHNKDFDLAVKTVEAAKEAGADAIKFQTYTPDTITVDCNQSYFKINHGTIWDGQTLYDLYKKAYMPWDWQPKLKKIAESLDLIWFSSPFDDSAIDFLEKIDIPAYKIASPEITDLNLIKYAASKNKPIIISTGIAKYHDIVNAVQTCHDVGNYKVGILKCTSSYPAPYDEINLKVILDLKKKFNAVIGLSDHTLGNEVSIASVALGAKIIEKHFMLDKKIKSPDSLFSLDKKEFSSMVKSVRNVEKALGKIDYQLSSDIKVIRQNARSLFIVKDVKLGEKFSKKNIRSIRPGQGLPPIFLDQIVGKKAKKNFKKGTPVSKEMLL